MNEIPIGFDVPIDADELWLFWANEFRAFIRPLSGKAAVRIGQSHELSVVSGVVRGLFLDWVAETMCAVKFMFGSGGEV